MTTIHGSTLTLTMTKNRVCNETKGSPCYGVCPQNLNFSSWPKCFYDLPKKIKFFSSHDAIETRCKHWLIENFIFEWIFVDFKHTNLLPCKSFFFSRETIPSDHPEHRADTAHVQLWLLPGRFRRLRLSLQRQAVKHGTHSSTVSCHCCRGPSVSLFGRQMQVTNEYE